MFHRLIDESFDAREVHDGVEPLLHLLPRKSHDRTRQEDVFAAGQLGMESGAQLKQRRDRAVGRNRPPGRNLGAREQ